MKRLIVLGLVVGLVLAALAAPTAAKKKKKKKPKPVATSLYLHGTEQFGEVETAQFQASIVTGDDDYMLMDPTEPAGPEKSMMITTYGVGPNPTCAGNSLFPVWTSPLTGTITGDIKVTLFTTSMPAQIDLRVWPDVLALACNEDYPEPARELRIDVPAGEGKIEAVLEGDPITAAANLMFQVSPASIADPLGSQRPIPPFVGRVYYDSEAKNSNISFDCLPAKGAKTCVPPPPPAE